MGDRKDVVDSIMKGIAAGGSLLRSCRTFTARAVDKGVISAAFRRHELQIKFIVHLPLLSDFADWLESTGE